MGKSRKAWIAAASLALALVAPRVARADSDFAADPFALGDGHSGAKVVASSGEVINAYAPLTADANGGATQLQIGAVIGNAAGFAAGDLVLLWAPASPGTYAFADGLPAWLGTWDLARIATVNGSTLSLGAPLLGTNAHFPALFAEVVKIPEYTTVTVPSDASLVALPWNGNPTTGFSGGILAFFASGAVVVNGTLGADAAGFRGGPLSQISAGCTDARSGEGVFAATFAAAETGQFSSSYSGGGGGACPGNGGAGGGGVVFGGDGHGKNTDPVAFGGGGDLGLWHLEHGLVLGGGGGAGAQSNGLGSDGGAGGGAIFIRAASLDSTGRISANGEMAANSGTSAGGDRDGSGGGGAGGTVIIQSLGAVTCPKITAWGGTGGDASGLGADGGGSGAGGGISLQTTSSVTSVNDCPTDVSIGAAPGVAVTGVFCTDPAQCGDGVCMPQSLPNGAGGGCQECGYDFGQASPLACGRDHPFCEPGCAACNNDYGVGTTNVCPIERPTCLAGPCVKCTTDADCTGPWHLAHTCIVASGICGTSCSSDSDCSAAEWCSASTCRPKLGKGERIPTLPPFDGACTADSARACLAAGCDPASNTCGRVDGSPCILGTECQNHCLANGVCGFCRFDTDCAAGELCFVPDSTCGPGCREIDGKSNCPAPQTCSVHDGTAGDCLAPPETTPATTSASTSDAGVESTKHANADDGGCSSTGGSAPPWELALLALVAVRRRRVLEKEKR